MSRTQIAMNIPIKSIFREVAKKRTDSLVQLYCRFVEGRLLYLSIDKTCYSFSVSKQIV